jgi:hypothetical protein
VKERGRKTLFSSVISNVFSISGVILSFGIVIILSAFKVRNADG